jgi:hypothetical protein
MSGTDVHIPLLTVMAYVIAAANMGLIFLIQRARLRFADLWSFQIVFLTIPFVLKTSWPHDFVFLPFTQALLIWWLLEGKYTDSETGTTIKWQVLSFLVLPSIIFSNIVFFNLFGDFARYGSFGSLFWASLLLLIALYVQLLPPAIRKIGHSLV